MITMKGAAVSAKLKEQVEKGLETLTWVPKLTIIRVGENPDDISYEKGATKKLTSFGLEVELKVFPGDISDEAFKKEFAAINADASVDGILMLRPLPKQINEQDIEKMIDPAKDLDGISPVNIAKVFSGDTSGFAPCTAEAVVCMLKMNDIALSGKRVAVVGRSMVVGRPLSMLLLHENATVTICHSRSENLPDICREADILVVAAGKAGMVGAESVRAGQVVLDVGIHVGLLADERLAAQLLGPHHAGAARLVVGRCDADEPVIIERLKIQIVGAGVGEEPQDRKSVV